MLLDLPGNCGTLSSWYSVAFLAVGGGPLPGVNLLALLLRHPVAEQLLRLPELPLRDDLTDGRVMVGRVLLRDLGRVLVVLMGDKGADGHVDNISHFRVGSWTGFFMVIMLKWASACTSA